PVHRTTRILPIAVRRSHDMAGVADASVQGGHRLSAGPLRTGGESEQRGPFHHIERGELPGLGLEGRIPCGLARFPGKDALECRELPARMPVRELKEGGLE